MLKKNILVGICVFFLGLSISAYAADTEVILEDNTPDSGFAVKNASGETTVRAGGDGIVNGGNSKNWIFPILIPTIIDKIGNLDPGVFKNSNNQNALINTLNAVVDAIDNGDYEDSLNKLKNDILKKTNGCATIGEPDKDDWITDCDAQATIYPVVLNAIALLEQLI